MKCLSEAFKQNTTLEDVHIWKNPINDEGLKSLGEAIKNNEKISTLVLGISKLFFFFRK